MRVLIVFLVAICQFGFSQTGGGYTPPSGGSSINVSDSAWGLIGNSNTNNATNFIGTTNNVGLSFRTNNVIRQTIDNNGFVGIGTTAPATNVHINNNTNAELRVESTGTTPTDDAIVSVLNGTTRTVLSSFGAGDLGFVGTESNDDFGIQSNNITRITVKNTGNVGIGITNPTEILEVGGNITTQTATNQNARVSVYAGTGTTAAELNLGRNGARIWHFGLQGTNRFSFVESGVAERISVLQGGNVGINMTTQTSTFQVNGSQAGSITNITATTTLNETHHKILVSNGVTNITITLPNALTCLGREYIFSRAAGSTGSITIVGGAGNQMQALTGTVGATTSIALHGATGQGLNVRFTAVNIAGVGYWVRL